MTDQEYQAKAQEAAEEFRLNSDLIHHKSSPVADIRNSFHAGVKFATENTPPRFQKLIAALEALVGCNEVFAECSVADRLQDQARAALAEFKSDSEKRGK